VLLQYGVEGEHYQLIDHAVSFNGIPEQNRKPYWTGLADGYLDLPIKYPDQWQAIVNRLQYNEGPKLAMKNGIDPYEGFVFDTEAGIDEYMRVLQLQLDKFAAAR